ncbi:hypothetical protein L210DRAFT_3576557 [Boletus edulis BED1]|uniref:Uncharacterized protein n=1 Tax=Boletus edulis BED1 TaxID=1328754 RepID=A0AAD4G681_BOLED|nr:hypothetical protein L210DRAFT_3576557 [Boletus edulis BED1]
MSLHDIPILSIFRVLHSLQPFKILIISSTFANVNAFTPSRARFANTSLTTLSPSAIAALPLKSSRTAGAGNIRYTTTSTPLSSSR